MKAGVVGASGYLGGELLRLLAGHPAFEVEAVQADSSAGAPLGELHPGLAPAYAGRVLEALDPAALVGLDVVFVAVPAGRSHAIVPPLLGEVRCVVDLGADFRLRDASAYERWYGFTHGAPDLLGRAVYGLPELFRPALRGADLVAAPGCYPTAACLALAPLLSAGAIDRAGIVVDAASGTSGAGRSLTAATHHAAANESFCAYSLVNHRHTPEMEQVLGAELLFTPHLAPMTRGILATCYATASAPTSTDEVLALLERSYAGEPFVQVAERPPATRDAYGANTCLLSARYDRRTGRVLVLAALDNLVKGGAGQAIQAANLACGLDETLGLSALGMAP